MRGLARIGEDWRGLARMDGKVAKFSNLMVRQSTVHKAVVNRPMSKGKSSHEAEHKDFGRRQRRCVHPQ